MHCSFFSANLHAPFTPRFRFYIFFVIGFNFVVSVLNNQASNLQQSKTSSSSLFSTNRLYRPEFFHHSCLRALGMETSASIMIFNFLDGNLCAFKRLDHDCSVLHMLVSLVDMKFRILWK
ncbi:hypothetical protein CMV_014954 [Castanea mollissima]|uniref:Uncharacterized protein n=1 Tax=Castanea mollissima TaxID=60419 RepID=A0A8J4VKK0_9ROSI|nr:hypothetical protein CMV_014954 [Castanea mollissima]